MAMRALWHAASMTDCPPRVPRAWRRGHLDVDAVRGVAQRHHVCPYYLSQELAKWSDMVVGDYNYWFDGSAMLYGMTVGGEWRGFLADEADNLVERARSMYSATLSQAALRNARTAAVDMPAGIRQGGLCGAPSERRMRRRKASSPDAAGRFRRGAQGRSPGALQRIWRRDWAALKAPSCSRPISRSSGSCG